MPKREMRDVIVLLPGIMGSRLKKAGRVAWGFSPGALATALLSRGRELTEALMLKGDSPGPEDLGDGVVADSLLPDLHLLPGFWKIDGYSKVADVIQGNFDVTEGRNYFPFPYDWRRDNRCSAHRLAAKSREWLRSWRESSGAADAKLILVAHSMGGLVSRYFLECLEGWRDTRALLTFGTPYRGSVNAVDTLVHGVRKGPLGLFDISELARSLTAIYQLLPIYPCYDSGDGKLERIGEAQGVPNVDSARAADALAFHREIENKQKENAKLDDYRNNGYKIIPIVGVEQPTRQSARLAGDAVELLSSYDNRDYSGDGTVPRVSATPIELSDQGHEMYAATQHGSLQNSDPTLVQVTAAIEALYFSLGTFRKPSKGGVKVSVEVGDLYAAAERPLIRARPVERDVNLRARVRGANGTSFDTALERSADGWQQAQIGPLPEGAYTVTIEGEDVEPAEDAFAVAAAGIG